MNQSRCGGGKSRSRMEEGCESLASQPCWIALSSKRSCRCCRSSGTRRSPITAMGFDRGGRRIKPWHKRSSIFAQGYGWGADVDLEKFFDRVNHDKLMGQVAKRVEDKRLLKLIRAFLNAGVMENGLLSPSVEGTPQGGPLSPLLSNLVLDELDQELERRGHRFVRYADDCNIYVRSERAGQRASRSITRFITRKLKLKVNEAKSAVARPQERKFLGFSFTAGPDIKRKIAPKSLERVKQRMRVIP